MFLDDSKAIYDAMVASQEATYEYLSLMQAALIEALPPGKAISAFGGLLYIQSHSISSGAIITTFTYRNAHGEMHAYSVDSNQWPLSSWIESLQKLMVYAKRFDAGWCIVDTKTKQVLSDVFYGDRYECRDRMIEIIKARLKETPLTWG
jgi:hypothetical protein